MLGLASHFTLVAMFRRPIVFNRLLARPPLEFFANRYDKVKAQIEAFSFFQFYLPVTDSGERVTAFGSPFPCCRIHGRTTTIRWIL